MKSAILPVLALILLIPSLAQAQEGTAGDVQVVLLGENQTPITSFYPFGEDYTGQISLASGDLGADGTEEIIVGSGPNLPPKVKIFRQDGTLINEFSAYNDSQRNGITVAVCDLNNDKLNEIVTGTMFGAEPRVKIFDSLGNPLYGEGFLAYNVGFRGGVNIACGDVDGDKNTDIITGAGLTGGPHIRVFTPEGKIKYEIFAGSASENSGVTVAAADIDGNGESEIISGRMGSGDPTIMVFDLRRDRLSFMIAFSAFNDYQNGVQVTSGDIDGDGRDEIGVSTSRHETGVINFFKLTGAPANSIKPFDSSAEKGVVATTIDGGTKDFVLASSVTPRESNIAGKYIKVDIGEQKLYAYENGLEVKNFLVSTGTYAFPTPLGKTQIYEKVLWKDYAWSYGENNPNNYFLPGVKYNLRFRPHMYIHYAYWHNSFGRRKSHGCINVNFENAEWIYNWADVGTPIEVVP